MNVSKNRNYFLAAGHVYFLVMIILAVVFAQDRLCRDPSYYLARIINERVFIVEHYRFTTVITQALALLGVWLQLPLRWVIALYSIADYLFYYAVFLLLAYRFKNEKYLLIYLLCLCVGTDYLFFLPGLVLLVGVAFMLLFFAFLEEANLSNYKHLMLLLLLQLLALYSYPTLFIPLFFLLGILYLLKNISLRTLLLLSLSGIVVLVLKSLLKDPYDAGIINFMTSRQHFETVRSEMNFSWVLSFVREYTIVYWPLIAAFIAVVVMCTVRKNFLQLSASLFIPGIIIFLVYSNTYHLHDAYFERLQYLVVPMVAGWVVLNIFQLNKAVAIIKGAIILLLVYNTFHIIEARSYYHERVERITGITEEARLTDGEKFTLVTHTTPIGPDIDDWSLSIESMIYSSLSSPDSTMTVYRLSDANLLNRPISGIGPDDFIFRMGDVRPNHYLNPHYFRLRSYIYVPLNKSFPYDTSVNYHSIIRLDMPTVAKLKADQFNQVETRIINLDSTKTIASLSTHGRVYLRYQFLHENGRTVSYDKYKMPLDIDVIKDYSQLIYVHAPSVKGNYLLRVEMATDEGTLKGVNTEVNCSVE